MPRTMDIRMPWSFALRWLLGSFCISVGVAHAINATWQAPSRELWAERTVYQVLTDRLDRGDGSSAPCNSFNRYCGGTWKGITKMLPYIKDMGFDAIWFSPVSQQTGGLSWEYPDGFHGYWPRNLWEVNSRFGAEADLKEMIDTMHSLGMWAMLDIVPNHIGYGALSEIAVFNDTAYFHTCDGCQPGDCGYWEQNDWQARHCRLARLPDLDQDHPVVARTLLDFHSELIRKFQVDGFRVDAAKHIEVDWLQKLRNNLSIFTIGEFVDSMENIQSRLQQGALDSSLNFPLFSGILGAFADHDMDKLRWMVDQARQRFGPDATTALRNKQAVFGNFVENHDSARFLCRHDDVRMYQNAHAAIFFLPGIPIVYYGAELGMRGQRDPLWSQQVDTSSRFAYNQRHVSKQEMYKVIQRLIRVRKAKQVWEQPTTVLTVSGDHQKDIFAFSRGDNVVVVLNSLKQSPGKGKTITLSGLTPRQRVLQDVLFPKKADGASLLIIHADGTATVTLSDDRWPQVFALPEAGDTLTDIRPFVPYQPATVALVQAKARTILKGSWVTGFILAVLFSLSLRWDPGKLPSWQLHTNTWSRLAVRLGQRLWPSRLRRARNDKASPGAQGRTDAAAEHGQVRRRRGKAPAAQDQQRWDEPPSSDTVSVTFGSTSADGHLAVGGPDSYKPHDVQHSHDTAFRAQSSSPFEFPPRPLDVTAQGAEGATCTQHTNAATPGSAGPSRRPGRPTVRQIMANNSMLNSLIITIEEDSSHVHESPSTGSAGSSTRRHMYVAQGGCVSPAVPSRLLGVGQQASRSTSLTSSNTHRHQQNDIDTEPMTVLTPAYANSSPARPPQSGNPFAFMPPSSLLSAKAETPPSVNMLSLPDDMVLNVAMEYSIPHLADKGFGDGGHFMFGGLGKVVHMFLIGWPGPVGLCCPLYNKAYNDPDNDTVPSFLPPDTEPTLAFSVTVAKRYESVEVFTVQEGNVTYFFVQAAIFKHRLKEDIYTFEEEEEMLRWISIMNQSVAAIISTFNFKRVQFHDWHATLSLLYLPQDVMPEVLLILHNAHYNGTFPVPDKDRKVHVYGVLDLDCTLYSNYLEYKGNMDMLNSVLTWIREHQGGRGCVAVSKRYAESILQKLDVMWQMRPYGVTGILNALPFTDCLASQIEDGDMTIEQALKFKSESKAIFQHKFGLKVGPVGEDPFSGPQLVVFLGRMTHQKGADVIAMAADYFLAKCPQCQLVFVGPICDKTGADAEQLMGKVVHKYGSNRVLFLPKVFGGAEKKLLINATDFCLVPSRFEPCGLVDIEFGWNGAIMVGHNTGGLDKMPGIMYSVESNARAHLAAQLSQAVVKALSLTPTQRRHMFEEAMSRRFPVEDMMREYVAEWARVAEACSRLRREAQLDQTRIMTRAADQHFFSTLWRKHNRKDMETHARAESYDHGKPLPLIARLTGIRMGRHQVSSLLLLLLQSFCLLPAAMVTGYATFVYLGNSSIEGCEALWDQSSVYWSSYWTSLVVRVTLNYGTYAAAAPLWMMLAMLLSPRYYIYLTVVLVLGSALLAHAAMVWTWLITPAITACSAIAPVGLPLISLNFLGQNLEVAEVGLKYMAVTESTMNLYLFLAALLAAVSTSLFPYVAVQSCIVVLTFLVAGWFSNPDVLHPAYKRVRLVLRKQWGLITRITSFWLTTLVMITENVALVLTAYQVLLDWDLRALLYLAAALFGARMLAVLATYVVMNLRFSQLRVQGVMLALATLPGFAIAKQLAVMYSPSLGAAVSLVTLVEFIYGCRFQLVGLLAFQTLPSRELAALWQLITMLLGTLVPVTVLVMGYTRKPDYGKNGPGLLVGVAICEAVRLAAMGGLWKVHPRENLATL